MTDEERIVVPMSGEGSAGEGLILRASGRELPELARILCHLCRTLVGEVLDVDGDLLVYALAKDRKMSDWKHAARTYAKVTHRKASVAPGAALYGHGDDLRRTSLTEFNLFCPKSGPVTITAAYLISEVEKGPRRNYKPRVVVTGR